MFSGAGEFFRPVELRKDLPPIAYTQPVSKAGDEDPREREEFHRRLSDITDETAISGTDAAPADDNLFGDDFIELSLPALQAMLTGDKTAHAYGRPPVQASPDVEPAFAAYRRAADVAPDLAGGAAAAATGGDSAAVVVPMHQPPGDEWKAAAAHHPDADAGSTIFYMLAALENAGVPSVTVKDRQTIYAALRRRCLDLGIPIEPPAAPSV